MDRYRFTQELLNGISAERWQQPALDGQKQPGKKKLLVVFCGGQTHLQPIGALKRYGFSLHAVVPSLDRAPFQTYLRELHPDEVIQSAADAFGYTGVLIPDLTQGVIAALAHGIQASVSTETIWQALWNGVPVYADVHPLMGGDGGNETMRKIVRENVETVKQMGLVEIDPQHWIPFLLGREETNSEPDLIEALHPDVITEKDLHQLLLNSPELKELVLSKRTIVTPLARDAAKKQGIKIIRR